MFKTFCVAMLMNSKVTACKCFAFTPTKIFGSNFTLNQQAWLSIYQADSKPETKIYKRTK